MKELFQKLSNLFSFGKEHRLVNEAEKPDTSGPDDSNIDPLKVPLGHEAPDMSGPDDSKIDPMEVSVLVPKFIKKVQKEAAPRVAMADIDLKKLEKEKPEPRKFTEKEKQILDFEDKDQKTWDVVEESVKLPFIASGEPIITREGEGREMNLEPMDFSLQDKPEALSEYGDYEQMFKDAKGLARLISKPGKISVKSKPLFRELATDPETGKQFYKMTVKEDEEDYGLEGSEWVTTNLKDAIIGNDIKTPEIKEAIGAFDLYYQQIIDNAEAPKKGEITPDVLLATFTKNYNRLPKQTKREILGYILACQRHDLLVSRDQFVESLVDELQKPKAGRKQAGEVLAYYTTHPEERGVAEEGILGEGLAGGREKKK